ncbi:MAG: hypothetical protein AAGG50_03860 [Bacteroidota bacterium]
MRRFLLVYSVLLLTFAGLLTPGCKQEALPADPPAATAPDEAIQDEFHRRAEEMRAESEETRRQIEAIQQSDGTAEPGADAVDGHYTDEIEAARGEADSLHQALIDQIGA